MCGTTGPVAAFPRLCRGFERERPRPTRRAEFVTSCIAHQLARIRHCVLVSAVHRKTPLNEARAAVEGAGLLRRHAQQLAGRGKIRMGNVPGTAAALTLTPENLISIILHLIILSL